MQVKDVMTATPACCTANASLQEVANLMVENDCGAIPVVDSEDSKRPVGLITDRDIVCRVVAEGLNPLELTANDCMTSDVLTVTEQSSFEECCRLMEEKQVRRVPVVDENGACVGIVALADVAREGRKTTAGEVVKEVSNPTASAASAS
jgi:CBS domain-containing protein